MQKWVNRIPDTCQCCAQGKDARRDKKRQRCCARGVCCKEAPSARTVSDIRACLRSALSNAVREELISKNVAANIVLPAVRKRKGKAWSSEEARQFLESARRDRDPLYAAYVLILVLGLRKGEVLGLTWDDVDFEAEELSVALQLQRVQRQLLHRETKTEASDDSLPLVGICAAALRERKQEQQRHIKAAGAAWQRSKLIFTTRSGTPVEPRNFNRSWDARVARSGVRKITVHDGRRTCATLLVDLDVHAAGHADPPSRRVLGDDGDLRQGVEQGHQGRSEAVGGQPRRLRPVAVLRCCTNVKGPVRRSRTGPLTCCGAEGNRTPDLLDANETRYQLRYSPSVKPAKA
ncbi:hypothetical protein Atai01_08290 [Amycolatopsis taiwanensis]|uniref:Tyr recombinase domain-containing protein n=1 Tax=Amycolatopsis taiwanensis TaxID=342230 RepID=A0A9W6QYB5_9PSEU|nr:hypothetical protein Atai01_08290 [Amycolatopsis taiwanensis]